MHKGFSSLFPSNREVLSLTLFLQHNKLLLPVTFCLARLPCSPKGIGGGHKNSTPSASRRSLKILRGIFLKNVFRGWGSRREFWVTRQGLNGPTGLIFHLLMCSSFHGIATTGSCKCFLYLHLSFGDFSFQLVQPVSSVGSFKPCLKVQISDAKHSEYHDQTQ